MRLKVMGCEQVVRVAGRLVRQDIPQRLMRGEVVVALVDALLRSLYAVGGVLNAVGGVLGAVEGLLDGVDGSRATGARR